MMISGPAHDQVQEILRQAMKALASGEQMKARHLAIRAALLYPQLETPWLILAAVVQPEASLTYLSRALEVNPSSERARRGMAWVAEHQPQVSPGLPPAGQPAQTSLPSGADGEHQTSPFLILLKRLASSALILLAVAFLTLLGFYLAQQGRAGLPVQPLEALVHTARQLFSYLFHHPGSYFWHKVNQSAFALVSKLFVRSAGLLLLSLLLATVVGGSLGILAARLRRRNLAPVMILGSILGISLPSFLVAMLLWVVDFRLYRWLGTSTAPLPPTGFGWDLHLVMPVLVLAARPLAQIMQVTYISMVDVLDEEFMRTAKAKGASYRHMLWGHAMRNVLIPILTTMSTSLRFSLASLPVVETFFLWPGIGLTILEAIREDQPFLTTDLILSLGLFFLLVNVLVEFTYPLIDVRLRKDARVEMDHQDLMSSPWVVLRQTAKQLFQNVRQSIRGRSKSADAAGEALLAVPKPAQLEAPAEKPGRFSWRLLFGNLSFLGGTVLVLAFVTLIIFGGKFTDANPYQTHSIVVIEGQIQAPPFLPSSTFPWGSDAIGRDIQALVLAGAKQTLTLAFVATIARVLLGTVLGIIAGWWQDRWVDRLIQAAISVWAAFPETIFAMLLILALGIQKGRSVFIIALCVVGWGQIAQFVRSQVISQKPALYIEAARSVGSRALQILWRHTIPYLLSSVVVLSVLEMGGVLMLLAELGFLNIFLGGGFKAVIGEGASMTPIVYYFSDVPEWGALLANIRNWWRSYPWLAWYPGVFFFVAIFTFNLWGEGMRRFLRESRINLNRLVNRYTVTAGVVLLAGVWWVMRSTSTVDLYKEQAAQFTTENVMQDIAALTSPEFGGRESGTEGAAQAAAYIAGRMAEVGLVPGVNSTEYLQEYPAIWAHLTGTPEMQILDGSPPLVYRQDFSEYSSNLPAFGSFSGTVTGLVYGEGSKLAARATLSQWGATARYELRNGDLLEHVLVVREKDLAYINLPGVRIGALVVIAEDDSFLTRRKLHPTLPFYVDFPAVVVPPVLGDQLLQTAGSSLADLERLAQELEPDAIAFTGEGVAVRVKVEGSEELQDEKHYNVIGVIPGSGAQIPMPGGGSMDSQIILVSAYFDGLGTAPDGTFYPGANDNASGVAEMLEIARVLKQGEYFPKKTVVFVAWSGGQRSLSLSTDSILGNTSGLGMLNVEAILELSGVGAGSGHEILLAQGSSYRLVTLYENAARRMGSRFTTRGRGPHFGQEVGVSFGGRDALTAYVHWNGSDQYTGTPQDALEIIDPKKLQELGETTTLVVTVLSREIDY